MKRILYNDNLTTEEEKCIVEDYAAANDMSAEDIDDAIRDEIIRDYLEMEFSDLEMNCSIYCENPILVIVDVGRWNGRKKAYKIIDSGLLSDIFHLNDSCDYHTYYTDGYNVLCTAIHHDGVNYYEFREIKNDDNITTFLDNLLTGKYKNSRRMLNYYTKSILPKFKEIYNI